ncbi:MAG: type II toxin-antitoxin system VapC family toxin [Firmicutes bacterium]|nr:type II toxin-antitoxin system VapC family toxin [Bacillota bacterium]
MLGDEVFKRIQQQRDKSQALRAVAAMAQGRIVELDLPLALNAAKLSSELKLPMADSIMLATARAYGALLWTQDADKYIRITICCRTRLPGPT